MKFVRIAVYNISYIRKVFEKEFFCDMSIMHTGMKIKQLVSMDEESRRLVDWIDKGVYDALQKRYLRSILFGIFEEGGPLIEQYCISFHYAEDVAIELQLTGCTESIWTFTSNAESFPSQIWSSAATMIERLLSVLSAHKEIPEERSIMMRLLYFDDITPPDYEPPFFKYCDDDMRGEIPKTAHSTSKDISQDLTSLPCDKKSMFNDDCSDKDTALGSDTKIARGYLYCITKKKVTFYFDSGASCHMCGDNKLIKNLHEVPAKDRVAAFDANGNEMLLHEAGEIRYEKIRLSPVYYSPGINYNIISLGKLDDGNNLIYTGDKRVKIFDVSKGVMIGEGYMHKTRNEYIARSITSIKVEASSSTKSGQSTTIEAVIEEQSSWIVDSLCNNHMTGNKKILYDRRSEARTFMTPKGEITSTQIGTVRTDELTLFNVYYCPNLRSNIISEGQLDRDGYTCTRFAHKVNIQLRATQEIVGVAHQDENSLYYVDHCRYVGDPSSNQSKDDEKPSRSLKHSRQHIESCSTSRKRIK